jgi:hypothetical protein
MDVVSQVLFLVGLFVIGLVLWTPPQWLRTIAEPGTPLGHVTGVAVAAADAPAEEFGLFSLAFVRRRMELLAAELDRLDREPAIFARGFRTTVAMSAYAALEDDARRLAAVPRLDLGPRVHDLAYTELMDDRPDGSGVFDSGFDGSLEVGVRRDDEPDTAFGPWLAPGSDSDRGPSQGRTGRDREVLEF